MAREVVGQRVLPERLARDVVGLARDSSQRVLAERLAREVCPKDIDQRVAREASQRVLSEGTLPRGVWPERLAVDHSGMRRVLLISQLAPLWSS